MQSLISSPTQTSMDSVNELLSQPRIRCTECHLMQDAIEYELDYNRTYGTVCLWCRTDGSVTHYDEPGVRYPNRRTPTWAQGLPAVLGDREIDRIILLCIVFGSPQSLDATDIDRVLFEANRRKVKKESYAI